LGGFVRQPFVTKLYSMTITGLLQSILRVLVLTAPVQVHAVESISSVQTNSSIRPGEVWLDVEGQPIQAHGGGMLLYSNRYYWHGEDRTPRGEGAVAAYSSSNLLDWKREGIALFRQELPREDGRRTFVERPKVIYNAATKKFVMWMHLEGRGYNFARAGIATSVSPAGPFTFLKAIRPITNDFGFEADSPMQQKQLGGTYRDMNLFVDDDGRAYAFYSSEGNWTLYVVRLNREFTGPEEPTVEGKTWARTFVRKMREAPAPFKHQGRYYVITSGCTGWNPNAAEYAVADNILGPWTVKGNPVVGPEAGTTFHSQSTFVFPFPGKPGGFVFMADRWKPQNLSDSRYIWLPFFVSSNDTVRLEWKDAWRPSDL
jgi:hypothetical protein